MTLNCRSWALQQYDESKKGAAVAAVPCIPPTKPRAAAAPTQAKTAERKGDEGWDLCGWQDEPSVVSMGWGQLTEKHSAQHLQHVVFRLHAKQYTCRHTPVCFLCSLLQHVQRLPSWHSIRQPSHQCRCPAPSTHLLQAPSASAAGKAAGARQLPQEL